MHISPAAEVQYVAYGANPALIALEAGYNGRLSLPGDSLLPRSCSLPASSPLKAAVFITRMLSGSEATLSSLIKSY